MAEGEWLRSLALAGRCFETWGEVTEAIAQATDYWNAHRHPFTWGQPVRVNVVAALVS